MKHNQKGLTIIETLLYMGLFAILLTVFTQVFVSMLETKLASESFSFISGDSKFIEQKISGALRTADSVVSPTAGNTSSTLQLDIGGVTNTFSLSGSDLNLNDGTGSYVLNTNNVAVDSFSVTNTSDEKIEVTISVTSNIEKIGTTDSKEIYIIHNIR